MSKAVSFRVNTDPTHTEDKDGYPEGSVVVEFFSDDDDYPPGTEGLDVTQQLGSITLRRSEAISDKWDGWYALDQEEVVEAFPTRLRDAIHGFMTASMAVARMQNILGRVVLDLPSDRQKAVVKATAGVCMSVCLEQPIEVLMQIWPEDETLGYVLVDPSSKYVAGTKFETYADAEDARSKSGEKHLRIGLLTFYPDGEPPQKLKEFTFNPGDKDPE